MLRFTECDVVPRVRPMITRAANNAAKVEYGTPVLNDTVRGRIQPSDGSLSVDKDGLEFPQDALFFTTTASLEVLDKLTVNVPGLSGIFIVRTFNGERTVRGKLSHYVAQLSRNSHL